MNWAEIIEFLDNSWITPATLLLMGALAWVKSNHELTKRITPDDDNHLPR